MAVVMFIFSTVTKCNVSVITLSPFRVSADDGNRVILKPLGNIPTCQHDYINACYINVC